MNVVGFLLGLAIFTGVGGLLAAAVILCFLLWGGRRAYYALSGKTYVPLLEAGGKTKYEHQDVNAGADFASINSVFKRNLSAKGVNTYARAGMSALESCQRKTANFSAVLDTKFQPGSITWQKFAGAADATRQAVLRNCAELANAIQVFDHEDYRRSERIRRASTYRGDSKANDPTQVEKRQHYHTQLADMQEICDRNDKLLLELDKLTTELQALDDTGSSAESDRLIEEVRSLAAETKYYKDALDNM